MASRKDAHTVCSVGCLPYSTTHKEQCQRCRREGLAIGPCTSRGCSSGGVDDVVTRDDELEEVDSNDWVGWEASDGKR